MLDSILRSLHALTEAVTKQTAVQERLLVVLTADLATKNDLKSVTMALDALRDEVFQNHIREKEIAHQADLLHSSSEKLKKAVSDQSLPG